MRAFTNTCISFIYSGYFYSTSSSPLFLRNAPRHSTDTVSEFHAKATQATASEGIAQGPNMAARAGFEPATLRTKGVESTNVQPCLTNHIIYQYMYARKYLCMHYCIKH